jgi:hypothetical protein
MLSRSIIDDSRSVDDTSIAVSMKIIRDAPSCGIVLITLIVSFMIVIFYNTGLWGQKLFSS